MQHIQTPAWLIKTRALAAIAVALLVSGCFGDGKQSSIRPEADSARVIHDVYALVTWIDIGILIVVTVLFFYAIIRYRAKKGEEDKVPEQVHGNPMLEVLWTIIPAVILIFIAVPTWQGIFRAHDFPTENVIKVKAIGHQWWWEFQYPEQGLVTANELYLPVGKSAVVETTSVDVIHSFWVPRLYGKIDSMPDRRNFLWFTPENISLYYGQCAEYCGTSHANMRFRVRVVSQEDFDAWVGQQKLPPAAESDDARAGGQLFVSKGCIACHKISGVPVAVGVLGPNLTNLASRSSLGSGLIENTPENLVRWIRETQDIKPGTLMGLLDPDTGQYKPIDMTEQEGAQIAAYLLSKPGQAKPAPAPAQAAAAPAGGKSAEQLMREKICITCHIIPGIPEAVGKVGPTLAGVGSRAKIAAGTLDNTPENMARWLANPPAVKPGTAMPPLGLSKAEIDTIVNFLQKLK